MYNDMCLRQVPSLEIGACAMGEREQADLQRGVEERWGVGGVDTPKFMCVSTLVTKAKGVKRRPRAERPLDLSAFPQHNSMIKAPNPIQQERLYRRCVLAWVCETAFPVPHDPLTRCLISGHERRESRHPRQLGSRDAAA